MSQELELSSIEQEETATIQLKHPSTGDELSASVTVYSPDSETFKAANTKMRAKITAYMSRNKGATDEQKQIAFDKFEKERNIALIKSVNNAKLNGETVTDVATVCSCYPFIYKQAVEAMDCASNFIKDSLPNA